MGGLRYLIAWLPVAAAFVFTPRHLPPPRAANAAVAFPQQRATTPHLQLPATAVKPSQMTLEFSAAPALTIREGPARTIESGARVWPSGEALARVLEGERLAGKRVLELGAGTGVAGLAAARQGAEVFVTDLPEMLPLLAANIGANSLAARAEAMPLRWGNEYDLEAALARGPFDLVIGTDILYAPERFDDLLATLLELTAPGAQVMLAYPRRFTEGVFFEDAEDDFDVLAWEDEIDVNVFATRLQRRADARLLYV